MFANVIEHSFSSIHKTLDPNFGNYDEAEIMEEIEASKSQALKEDNYYMVFTLVDGFYIQTKGQIKYEEIQDDERRICFIFNSQEEMANFSNKYFERILTGNGNELKRIEQESKVETCKLAGIYWLNKSEKTEATEYVKLFFPDNSKKWIPIDKVRIYFTGYKDRCPGIKSGNCSYSPYGGNCAKYQEKCTFFSHGIKYPDINRLVEFQEKVEKLDRILKSVITERLHNSSRVARMNYMGEKIILALLDLYNDNPRTMHDRVLSRLRIYPELKEVSDPLLEWVNKPIFEKEKAILPKTVLDCFRDTDNPNFQADRYSLIRTIINHIAGMTDRFIANEYNRVTQCGREVERQDETYFFS